MSAGEKISGKRFRHWLQASWFVYVPLVVAVRLIGWLPLGLARALGRLGGRVGYHLDRGHRAIALENLQIAFPEKSRAAHLDILRRSYIHLGQCVTDFCHFQNLTAESLKRDWLVLEPGADECARAALAQGKGLLAVTGHIGFWEVSGLTYPAFGFELVSIARKLAAPRIDALVTRTRAHLGNNVYHQEGALRHMLRGLKEGITVGIIMDQYAGRESPRVEFFGRPASTVDTVARLHLKTGAPMVCNFFPRQSDGRYLWRCRSITLEAATNASDDEKVVAILRACNREFEAAIREYPEQWLWMHKRWKPYGQPAPAAALRAGEEAPA